MEAYRSARARVHFSVAVPRITPSFSKTCVWWRFCVVYCGTSCDRPRRGVSVKRLRVPWSLVLFEIIAPVLRLTARLEGTPRHMILGAEEGM